VDTTLIDPLVGRVLDGRYRVEARLARGGMATVYTATDTRLDRTVAVKVMHPAYAEDGDFVARFRREAKAAARLSHPHVVGVYDQGSEPPMLRGGPPVVFLVMEYVAGRTLRDLLRERGRLSAPRSLEVLDPVLAALGAAHAAGLVHRDVKPENVLLADDGRIKVADFGLARAVESATVTASVTMLIGTVAYLAPEQVATGAADARTDVYAAGVLLYELLTGRPPYDGPNPMAVAFRHVHEDVPAPSTARPGLPRPVDHLVARATARDPACRFADAGEFLSALRRTRAVIPADPADVISDTAADTTAARTPAARTPAADTTVLRVPGGGAPRLRTTHQTLIVPRGDPAAPDRPAAPDLPANATPPGRRGSRRRDLRPRRLKGRLAVLAVVLLTAAAALTGWWLAIGRYSSAPGVLGLSRSAAEAKITAARLNPQWQPEKFSRTVRKGLVVFEQPAPGGRVLTGGAVTLALSKGPEVHNLPSLTGSPLDRARSTLATLGLRGAVTATWSDTVASDRVIRTTPRTGTPLHPGDLVALTVSKGRQPVPVPDTANVTFTAAKRELTKLGFTITRTEAFSDTVGKGRVISSTPTTGSTAPHGTAIALSVSKGPQLITVPDVHGRSVGFARQLLEAAGLRVRVFAPFGLGTVHAMSPPAGTKVRKSSTISLIAY